MTSTSGNNDLDVFQQFSCQLVDTLPMDDVRFITKLYSEHLLPGNLKSQVKSQKTSADKAALFLDSVIEPSVTIDGGSSFDKLLDVMRDSEYQHVKELSKQIRNNLAKRSANDSGLHSTTTECIAEPAPEKLRSNQIDVSRLKARYLRLQPTAKTDWPKHKVTQYIKLAIVEKEDVTLKNKNLNEVTKLTLQGDVDRILKKKQPLGDLREIFHYQKKPCPRLILIIGGPGIGKTTLAHEICLKWARDRYLSEDFDAVALIPLRCVQQKSLEDVMIEFVRKEVFEQMDSIAGSRCLIILEGLDEMAIDHQNNDPFFISLVKDCTVLEEATIMITSRPHACTNLNADRQVEVIGFGTDQIEEFIKKSFPNDKHSVSELLRQLNDYLHIKSLCYVPLNLVMITDIFQYSQNKKLPSTITQLYRLFLVMILQREDKKTVYSGAILTAANSESLKKMLPVIPINAIGTVFLLCRLSFCGFFDWYTDKSLRDWRGEKKWKDPKIIFTMADLAQCGIEITSEFDGFGLLKATHLHQVPTDTSCYNFSHLTIQEFLASLYITLLPQQEQISLMNDHFHSFPNVFIFLCGLTRLECNEMYQIVYSKLMQVDEFRSNPDVVPVTRCLYESHSTSQSPVPFTLNTSHNHLTLYDCYCASHVISHYPVLEVNMDGCHMGDTGVAILRKQYSDSSSSQIMEVLNFTGNDLTAVGMVDVMKMVKTGSTTLRELDVSWNNNGDNWISVITEGLQSDNSLSKLKLTWCDLSVKGGSCVGELLKVNNSLQKLVMLRNPFGDDGMSSVADGLYCNNTLTMLDVHNCEFSVKGASCVGESLKINNSLQELAMGYNPIGDDGMSSIADGLQCNNTLTKLYVKKCGFSVKGAISISQALIVNHTLLELHMEHNDIKDEGITAIAGSLNDCSVTVLNVEWCGITFTGVRSLAAALSTNQKIRKLCLMSNPITVDGARLIMKSALDNGICEIVSIDDEYWHDDQVKEMIITLRVRGIQDIQERRKEINFWKVTRGFQSTESTVEPAPKKMRSSLTAAGSTATEFTGRSSPNSSPIDVSRLKTRYLRLPPTAKTDWPMHKVTEYVRLALVEKDDVTLKDDNLNEVTELTLQGDVDRILKKKQPLGDLWEIFHFDNKPCPRLIVIMGGPGIGKTTLAYEVCLRWAKDGFLSEDFDVVALIPLRYVQQRSLKKVIMEFVGKEVFEQMDAIAGRRCLMILEGLDEMAPDRRNNDPFFIRLIKDCTVLEKATVMITSRPHACNKLNANRQVEVIGFGPNEIKQFVENSFPNDENSVCELLQQLNDYPNIKSMCYVPLNLVMISDIFKCKKKQLPSTLTELYKLFLVMTLKRHIEKKRNTYSGDTAASTEANYESLTKLLPDIPLNAIGTVFLLCRLSFCGFFDWYADMEEDTYGDEIRWRDAKIIFTSEDLNQCGIEVTGEFDGLGLLNATHIHDVPTDFSTYNFSHLTIQEFLSALYICLLPQQEQVYLMKEHFYDFTNIFMFLCGLTRLECSEIYQIIHSKLKSEEDLPVTMRCIHESNCTVQPTEPFPLTISDNHKDVLLPYDYYCLSYIISHYPVLNLDLRECYIRDTNAEMLAKYFSSKKIFNQFLKVLNLSFNELTAVAAEYVTSIVRRCTTLRELYIDSNEFDDDGISEIAEELKSSKTLRTLDISVCSFSDQGAHCVKEFLMANNSLQELDLEQNDIGDNGISSVAEGLQCNDTLTKLSVKNCGFSAKGAICLGELLEVNNALRELFICENDIDNEGMSSVVDGLRHNSTLTKLGVSGCELSPKGASYLGELLEVNNSLQELLMCHNPIRNRGMSSVANGLYSNNTLTKLNVSKCKFSVKGAGCLGKLLEVNNSLQELLMCRNPIRNKGMSSVADGLWYNNTLTKLDVSNCKFSEKGAISISQALMVNQTLLELNIKNNNISDKGITAIAGSLNSCGIVILNVKNCGITFTGAESLATALSTNQNIKKLYLKVNKIKVNGACLIMESAVDNGICECVVINKRYKNNAKVKKMMAILDDRKRQIQTSEKDESQEFSSPKSLVVSIKLADVSTSADFSVNKTIGAYGSNQGNQSTFSGPPHHTNLSSDQEKTAHVPLGQHSVSVSQPQLDEQSQPLPKQSSSL